MSSITVSNFGIVPDQVLEAHICRVCNKYLTVSPITVHPDGGNVCGRCHRRVNKDPNCLFECDSVVDLIEQVNIPYAIFGYVNHLFPCVNRYEGCKKLLAFEDIGNHETTCQPKKNSCRFCNYEGTGSQQLNHFKTKHPGNFFDKIYFRFPLNRQYFTNLIKRGHELFFLYFETDYDRQNVMFRVQPCSGYLDDDVDFFCLLKDAGDGEVIDQSTLSKRSSDGIYHSIHIKHKQFLEEYHLICECLLRRVSTKYIQID